MGKRLDHSFDPSHEKPHTRYAILSRDQPKLFKLSDKTVLGSTGCWCDILTFCKVAEMRLKTYRHTHNKSMSTPAVAQMTATMLYHKRY